MFVTNYSEHFNTITVSKFIGSKLVKYCPMFSLTKDGDYVFLNNDLLRQSIIKCPFYVKVYMKKFGF